MNVPNEVINMAASEWQERILKLLYYFGWFSIYFDSPEWFMNEFIDIADRLSAKGIADLRIRTEEHCYDLILLKPDT